MMHRLTWRASAVASLKAMICLTHLLKICGLWVCFNLEFL
jgi:hypothetical protein